MSSSPAVLSVRPPYAMPAPLPEFTTPSPNGESVAALALFTPFAGPGAHPVAREERATDAQAGAEPVATEPDAVEMEAGAAAAEIHAALDAPDDAPDEAPDEPSADTVVMASVETEPEETEPNAEPDAELPSIEQFLMQSEAPDSGDWPLAEAADDIAELVSDLRSSEPVAGPFVPGPQAGTSASASTPWSDDEAWMDIMPALPNTGAGDDAARSDWARAFAEPLAPLAPPPLPAGDAIAAATALEGIARRLRAGELDVPGFEADRGDAAALAAALASLLGARR